MSLLMPSIAIKKGVCQLLALNKFSVQQWLKAFDTIIFDADGVLWQHDVAIEGVPETFNALRAMDKQVFICTNHSSSSCATLCKKAQRLGLLVNQHEMLSSSLALARYLKERKFKRKVYIIGGQGIADELQNVGIESVPLGRETMLGPTMREHLRQLKLDDDVGAVAVGVDPKLNILKLTNACCYLADQKVLFLATNRDQRGPVGNDRFYPGAGVMVATVEASMKRSPFTCGKPNTFMCLQLIRDGVIKPERTLMVGDNMATDIQFGYNCGFQTLLVGTGVSSLKDVNKAQESKKPLMYQQVPDLYVPRLSDLLKFLPSRNG
ncbi:hypothetical protein KR222_007508 [Zaprionus bogoriensis]|nr:hypothetical protein KR222_007508 [Zaprionus bogoriensis]